MDTGKWRLPHGVDELLPPVAAELEQLRRELLDLFVSWGYEYVEPPLVEYLDALLVGSGRDLDLQTLKVVDQQSGRMLGVRADMTSQAARIDAHSRQKSGVQRLCYAGPVIFANPGSALDTRNPFKAGAELFGSPALEADAEVVKLMLESLRVAGVDQPVLLLGHMGLYRALTADLALSEEAERSLFDAVQRKAESDIADLLPAGETRDLLVALPTLMGDDAVLATARERFARAPEAAQRAIDELQQLVQMIRQASDVEVRFDLSELAGYGYHNGPVFAAYQADQGASLAQGGRYDGVGRAFGRERSATGFDVRLKRLVGRARSDQTVVWAPFAPHDAALAELVGQLRADSHVVVCALADGEARDARCVSEIVMSDSGWTLTNVGEASGS